MSKHTINFISQSIDTSKSDELQNPQEMCIHGKNTNITNPLKATELVGEIIQIPVEDIIISDIHLKIYESEQKRCKIEEIKESIKLIGQLEPIVIAVFKGQNYLLDGRIRLIAMKELEFKFISGIISPSANDIDTLNNLVMQYHIRKDLSTNERLNELIEILQIGTSRMNQYIGIDKRREIASQKLGRGFSRSKVIELENIIKFELDNDFEMKISKSILEGKVQLTKAKDLINTIGLSEYASNYEQKHGVIQGFIDKKYDINDAKKLLFQATKKNHTSSEISTTKAYPRETNNYTIREGNIFDVDISDQTFDVIFSSPPYSLQRQYGSNQLEEIGVEKDVDDYITNIADVFENAYNQLTDQGSLFVNINDTWKNGFSLNVIEKFIIEMERRGIRKVQLIHWEKPNPKPQGDNTHRYVNKFEYIIHFAKNRDYLWYKVGKPKTQLKIQKGCSEVGNKKKGYSIPSIISACSNLLSSNIIEGIDGISEIANSIKNNPMTLKRQFEDGEDRHTATFNMLLPLIPLLSSLPRDRQGIVFDPFTGTSTTGETALMLGHKFFGIELYNANCKTSARVLGQAQEKFKGINLMNELFDVDDEYAVAA